MTMKDFIRKPTNALTSPEEIKLGDKLYHAYGIWPPSASDTAYVVTREPIPFRDHPQYAEIHSSQADDIVFDVKYGEEKEYTSKNYAADGNIGAHHNSNYWFRSYEDAAAFVAQCREDWESNPEMIEEEKRRRDEMMMDDDFDDYEYNE